MKREEFKNCILEMLKDDDIKKKIRKICSDDEKTVDNSYVRKLESEKSELKSEIEECNEYIRKYQNLMLDEKNAKEDFEKENFKLKSEIEKLENQIMGLKVSLADSRDEVNSLLYNYRESEEKAIKYEEEIEIIKKEKNELKFKVGTYMKKYGAIEEIYSKYLNLDEKIKLPLVNAINYESIMSFICSGMQWENISSLWNGIKNRIGKISEDELQILNETFEWFFGEYNNISDTYEFSEVEIGEEFDNEKHIRSSDSAVSGTVKKVLLRGYINKINGKVTEKSVVKV